MNMANPELLCLNETMIAEDGLSGKDDIRMEMRKWFPLDLQWWNCSKPPKLGYSGTAVLISKDFRAGRPLKVEFDGFGEPGVHDQEGRTIILYFKSFILVNSYVPNAGIGTLKRLNYRVDSWDKDFHRFLK